MLELSPYRKNKINLEDYDYKQDIENRLIMARFSMRQKDILDEIIYSPTKIAVSDLAGRLEIKSEEILEALSSLKQSGLFTIDGDHLIINKEVRKYFETHLVKFEDEVFIPNMEFLQSLLRKVPIHVLPNWYHIPRSSNNIFESLIEKYLQTPQIFQRYLKELNLGDETLSGIVQDVFDSKGLKVSSTYLREKYDLTREAFEEYILHLEFNFVCCLGCEKKGDVWEEIVTPFYEWRQYLLFLQETTPDSIKNSDSVVPFRPTEYAFADDLALLLRKCGEEGNSIDSIEEFDLAYLKRLVSQSRKLQYAKLKGNNLELLPDAEAWLELSSEDRALQLFKHPLSEINLEGFSEEIATPKNIREAEKSVHRITKRDWVKFDTFMKGIITSLSEENKITLQKLGKQWKYKLPEYTESEREFISSVVLDWLFEGGIIQKGTLGDELCIKLTTLGKTLFE